MGEVSNVTPLRAFQDVERITHRKIESLKEWEDDLPKKRESKQIEVGRLLIELRDRIEEVGETTEWWPWFDENFREIERRTARHYMQIAGDPNPEQKQAELREAGTSAVRRHRASVALRNATNNQSGSKPKPAAVQNNPENPTVVPVPLKPAPTPEQNALVEQFVAIFRKMDDETRVRAMEEINAVYRRWREGEE